MDNRPRSIVNFERCYLGAFAIGLLNTALSWQSTRQQAFALADRFGSWFYPTVLVISFAITLGLWFFIARRGSVAAKWITTAFVALGVLGVLLAVPMGTYPRGILGVLGIVSTVLQAVAVWLLFRPDTKAWFGRTADSIA